MPRFIVPLIDIEQVKGEIFHESNISYLLIRKCKCVYHGVTTVTFTEDKPKMKSVPNISTQNTIKEESF